MYGEPPPGPEFTSGRPPVVAIVLATVVGALVLVVRFVGIGQSALPHLRSPSPKARAISRRTSLPLCSGAGIDVAGGREGRCVGAYGDGAGIIDDVVNGGHAVRMPGYRAEIVASRIRATRVHGPYADPADYPGHRAWLLSLKVRVTNDRTRPLVFDTAARDVTLFVPPRTPTYGDVLEVGELRRPNRAPAPRLGAVGAIAAHHSATGWVSFAIPFWSRALLHAPPAELSLRRADHRADELGLIRLWKFSSREARRRIGI